MSSTPASSRLMALVRYYTPEITALVVTPRPVELKETFKFITGFNESLAVVNKTGKLEPLKHPTMVSAGYRDGWHTASALWRALTSDKLPDSPDASKEAIAECTKRRQMIDLASYNCLAEVSPGGIEHAQRAG
jgi:hypothetical protein